MIGKLWEALGIVNGNLISGTVIFAFCVAHPIPQTMAGVQVDTDSDEFQAWYLKRQIGPTGRRRVSYMLRSDGETSRLCVRTNWPK